MNRSLIRGICLILSFALILSVVPVNTAYAAANNHQKIRVKLYLRKLQSNPLKVGNDTTMDAIRNEILTGKATAGTFHTIKGLESLRGMQNLINSGKLSYQDQTIADALIQDLLKAFAGK